MNEKPILAIETSGNICAASLYFNQDKYFSSKIILKHSHSEKLFELIDYVVKSSGISKQEIDSVAVSEGPGSFTGLRIGMSAAKGIATGSSLKIIAVPTFEAMALQLSMLGFEDEVAIANKVNREEVYFAKFQITANNYIFTEKVKIVSLENLEFESKGCKKFGNAFNNYFTSPDPEIVAEWAIKFGADLGTVDFDLMEPHYLKNVLFKESKNG